MASRAKSLTFECLNLNLAAFLVWTHTCMLFCCTTLSGLMCIANCTKAEWEKYVGYAAVGATQYVGQIRTIRQCQQHCERNQNCVGVDIDVNVVPLRCWPHFNAVNLRPSNVFPQPNTTHYRLLSRCSNVPAGTICFYFPLNSNLSFHSRSGKGSEAKQKLRSQSYKRVGI